MVRVPPINNQQTANRKMFNVLQNVGVSLFMDLIDAKKEAYFLDVEAGANPFGAFAFRLINGANDTVNFLTGRPLAETPTVQDVIDNPLDHFRRLMIGTNIDVRSAIAEAPERESEIMSGLQQRREAGETLAQVVANAVNADKNVRSQFDTYLINAREFATDALTQATVLATSTLDENLARLVNGLSDFFIDAQFARARRSGDGRRVSKEQHEYAYLSQTVISSYPDELFGIPAEGGFTHLQVAFALLQRNFENVPDRTGLVPDPEFLGILNGLDESILFTGASGDRFVIPPEHFNADEFSYGNFIDSYHMRRLLAELKKIVQDSRLDNISEFLRTSGMTRGEYIENILSRLSPAGFIQAAASEFINNTFRNPTRPVRRFIEDNQLVQIEFIGEDITVNDVGPLIPFRPEPSGPATAAP